MKFKSLLIITLVLLVGICYGQTKTTQTEKEEFAIKMKMHDIAYNFKDFYIDGTRNYKFYYNDDNKKVRHGQLTETAKGEEVIEYTRGNLKRIGTYSGSANYIDGEFNGIVKGSYDHKSIFTGRQNSTDYHNWTYTASFNKGIPTGTWSYTLKTTDVNLLPDAKYKGKPVNVTATFNNGKLASFSSTHGASITINEKGEISGKVENLTVKNGYAQVFQRGQSNQANVVNLSPLENEQREIITQLEQSKITIFEALDKGYLLETQGYYIPGSKFFKYYMFEDNTWIVPYNENVEEAIKVLYDNKCIILIKLASDDYATLEDCKKFCNKYSGGFNTIATNRRIETQSVRAYDYSNGLWFTYHPYLYVKTETLEQLMKEFEPEFNAIYDKASELMSKYEKENTIEALESYNEAQKTFNSILIWKDSKSKSEICKTRMSEIIDECYNKATALINKNKNNNDNLEQALNDYKDAKKILESLTEWKNPTEINNLTRECDTRINEIKTTVYDKKYDQAKSLMDKYSKEYTEEAINAHKNAIEILNSIDGWQDSKEIIELCEKRIAEINKTKELIVELNRRLNISLADIVEHTKNQTKGKVNFKWYTLSKNYFNFLGERCSEQTSLTVKFSEYCPMIGYVINSIKKIGEDKFDANCTINIKLPTKNEEYETYLATFILDSEGKIFVQNLNFKDAKKIRNEWDVFNDNNSNILVKSKECKNIVSSYSKYMKTAETTTANLKTIIANQEKILKAINSSNAVELDNKVKKLKDKSIESVIKEIQQ